MDVCAFVRSACATFFRFFFCTFLSTFFDTFFIIYIFIAFDTIFLLDLGSLLSLIFFHIRQ